MDVLSTDDISTANGHFTTSKSELSTNHITAQPAQTMVMSMPVKEKSDSSIAEVLMNEYVTNGDKHSKRSCDSEASMAGRDYFAVLYLYRYV